MVPKVAGKGASFKGAGLYYLHDKGADTAERVAFTYTENLPTDDPELAIKLMAYTAMHQAQIKAANDQPGTGRKLTKPVYAYSLSWAQDEQPTQEDMLEAAKDTLKLLELDRHEALFVIHNDTEHPHIHVIANRVHPETGIAAKLSKDHIRLSQWAEAYEQRQGQIRCEQRVENNARRAQGEFVRDTRSLDQAAFRKWRADRVQQAGARREIEAANLSATHRGERQFAWEQRERMKKLRLAELKEEYRPHWRALFQAQRTEKEKLAHAQRSALSRLLYVVKNTDLTDAGFKGALKAVFDGGTLDRKLEDKHEAARRELGERIAQRRSEALRIINKAHDKKLDKLKEQQRGERQARQAAHAQESQDLAKAIREGSDLEIYAREKGKTVSEEFRKRVGKRIRRARKKRDGRGKGYGRERE